MVRLTTPRLLLREYESDDWRDVQDYASDPEVCRYQPWGPNTPEQTREYVIAAMETMKEEPRKTYHLAVVLGARRIGGVRVTVQDAKRTEADLGYAFHRAHWGKGYATEAARAMLKFGFGELKLHRIWATCDPENVASAKVLEKAGMRLEGRFREYKFIKGAWRDALFYAILDREWNALA